MARPSLFYFVSKRVRQNVHVGRKIQSSLLTTQGQLEFTMTESENYVEIDAMSSNWRSVVETFQE